MTKDEALKLALEALENKSLLTPNEWKAVYGKAITTIKEALAQPAQEPYDQTALELCNVCGWKTLIPDDGCLNCERKAQPAQEPVNLLEARKIAADYGTLDSQIDRGNLYWALMKCLMFIDAQPVQEPVKCLDCGSHNVGIPATYDSLINSVKALTT
jgi:hypothetical protein